MMWSVQCICVMVAAVALGAAQPPQPTAQQQQTLANADLNARTARIVDAIDNIAAEEDAGCEDRKDKRRSDLCAQWGAVDANRENARATWFAVLLSFIGTALVALTFWEQRKVSRAELRAYITVKSATLLKLEPGEPIVARVRFVNSGQTPAKNVRTSWRIFACSPPYGEENESLPSSTSTGVLGPGDAGSHTLHTGAINQQGIDLIRNGDNHLIIHGQIGYEDAFNRQRRTKYRYQLVVEHSEGLFSVCDTGNEAT